MSAARWTAILTAIGAAFFSSQAGAVANLQSEKDATPIVVKCEIRSVDAREDPEVSAYEVQCQVREIIRASAPIERCEFITIAYQVRHADYQEEERSAEPGLAWPTPPPKVHDGQYVIAYLTLSHGEDNETRYRPNIGIDSFSNLDPGDAPECM